MFKQHNVATAHYVRKVVWTPFVGEELFSEVEDGNQQDKYTCMQWQ